MALPPGIKLVTVNIGPFVDFQGNPVAGRTTFSPSTSVLHAATGTPVLNRPVVVELDPAGMGVVSLPATDDAALTPTGFVYYAQHTFTTPGATPPALATIALPQAAPVVDLDLLIPVTGASGLTVSLPAVLSVAGKSGVVTGADLAAVPEVRALFVSAVDESGQPIPGKAGRVVFNSDGAPVTIEMVAVA